MILKELRKKVIEEITHCYLLKDSEIYELEIKMCTDGKVVTKISKERQESFVICFNNPNDKRVFQPHYANPFIDVMGIDENGKLILTDFRKGGFDIPSAYMTIQGDFFLTREDAEKAIKPKKSIKQDNPKTLIIRKIDKIKDYAKNCLYSEDIDFFDKITDEILELIKSI